VTTVAVGLCPANVDETGVDSNAASSSGDDDREPGEYANDWSWFDSLNEAIDDSRSLEGTRDIDGAVYDV
jgi:hypothetical protein